MALNYAFPEPAPHKKNWLFGIGLSILLVAWAFSLLPYLLLIAGPFYLLGAGLVWASAARRLTKITATVLPIMLWIPVIYVPIWMAEAQVIPETYLIPQHFRGAITVLYNEPCGQVIPTEKGRLVYRIPASGVLVVRHPARPGIIKQDYYFVDNQGRKTQQIKELSQQEYNEDYTIDKNPHEPNRQEIGVFLSGAGSGSNSENYNFIFSQIDVNSWEGLKASDTHTHEALVDSVLKACRRNH